MTNDMRVTDWAFEAYKRLAGLIGERPLAEWTNAIRRVGRNSIQEVVDIRTAVGREGIDSIMKAYDRVYYTETPPDATDEVIYPENIPDWVRASYERLRRDFGAGFVHCLEELPTFPDWDPLAVYLDLCVHLQVKGLYELEFRLAREGESAAG